MGWVTKRFSQGSPAVGNAEISLYQKKSCQEPKQSFQQSNNEVS